MQNVKIITLIETIKPNGMLKKLKLQTVQRRDELILEIWEAREKIHQKKH